MEKTADLFRMVVASPEVLSGVIVSGLYIYYPYLFLDFLSLFTSKDHWTLPTVVAVPIALLVAAYNIGGEVLSPHGRRSILLDWPEYWRLKSRIVLSLLICLISIPLTIYGYYLIHKSNDVRGLVCLTTSWVVSCVALMTVAYAKWTIREIFRE